MDQWHHPDDELPSESTTFHQLADVLTTGDLERYAPALPPNTHWSHWPKSGTLCNPSQTHPDSSLADGDAQHGHSRVGR